jgi:hypothetical protein
MLFPHQHVDFPDHLAKTTVHFFVCLFEILDASEEPIKKIWSGYTAAEVKNCSSKKEHSECSCIPGHWALYLGKVDNSYVVFSGCLFSKKKNLLHVLSWFLEYFAIGDSGRRISGKIVDKWHCQQPPCLQCHYFIISSVTSYIGTKILCCPTTQ